jgi:hypothetical protein
MKTLNLKATKIFIDIVTMCDNSEEGHVKIKNSKVFMPLCVELLYNSEKYKMYSFAHYYEQNGDLVPDPDMCFFQNKENTSLIFAATFQNAIKYTEAIEMEQSGELKLLNNFEQNDLAYFANIWMKNIFEQQFINF